jgi:KDO2-lipid IV(A) lauroyltransferase
MQWIGYFFLRLIAELFRLVPFRLLYLLSDAFAFIMHKVVGYRKGVMRDNLRRAFPDKPEPEIEAIMRLAYRNLTDVTLETIKGFTASLPDINRRCVVRNPEVINQFLDRGQSIILAGSHYNNWEWTGLSMPPVLHGTVITAYKPISNKLVDRYYNSRRERTGMQMVSMDDTYASMRKFKDQKAVFILLGDQSPSSRKSAHWIQFLGVETAFLPGTDFLARRFGFPVVYYHIERVRRGFYEVTYLPVWPDPGNAGDMDITRACAATLEKAIRNAPASWLWSHKRWKMKKEAAS